MLHDTKKVIVNTTMNIETNIVMNVGMNIEVEHMKCQEKVTKMNAEIAVMKNIKVIIARIAEVMSMVMVTTMSTNK
jgi:hypothetical protein